MSNPSAVLDTNILVSALLTHAGNPAQVVDMFLAGRLDLVYSAGIFDEYEDVLYRPRLRMPAEVAKTLLAAIRCFGEQVEFVPSTGAMPDEDDRVFYDTAKTAGAYLITGNVKHYPQEAFVLTPAEFLEVRE
jgi:putative PIN family toxin of toxin-antitoxin system